MKAVLNMVGAVKSETNGQFGYGLEQVFPERARQMLARNRVNRRANRDLVDRYARDMRNGKWQINGDAIVFNTHGELADGQHRLLACVQAGVPFSTLIVRNVEPNAQLTIDSGRKRTASDQLRFLGETNTSELAAASTFCWQYDHQILPVRSQMPTFDELYKWIEDNPYIREAVKVGKRAHDAMPIQRNASCVVYYLTWRVDADEADQFFDELIAGVGLHEGSPVLALRRWLDRWAIKRDRPSGMTYTIAALKACNAWRAGETIRQLHVKPGSPFPRVFGEVTVDA